MPTIQSSFLDDLASRHRDMLQRAGYKLPANAVLRDFTDMYLNARSRTIEPRPRRVHEAKDLAATCPAGMEDALSLFRAELVAGEDVNAHLSRTLMDPEYTDALLVSWDVHHFHLALTKNPEGFVTGQKTVLFGRITRDDAYLAYFGDHKRPDGGRMFKSIEIVEALHRNWPETLAEFRVEGYGFGDPEKNPEPTTTPQQWADWTRSTNLNAPVRTSDGTHYLIGARMTSGTSLDLRIHIDDWRRRYRRLEEHARATVEAQVSARLPIGTGVPSELRLRLLFDEDGKPYVQEEATGLLIDVPSVDDL